MWRDGPGRPPWPCSTVHVWQFSLAQDRAEISRSESLLSPDEYKRADSFLIPTTRSRFVYARAKTRQILARYLGSDPMSCGSGLRREMLSGVCQSRTSHRTSGCVSNLSHSQDIALLAVADHEVGVDLEHERPARSVIQLASLVLSPLERVRLARLTPSDILQVWTRKEAVLKAYGIGLARDPQTLTLQPPPEGGWSLVDGTAIANGWVRDISLKNGLFGALAVIGGTPKARFWKLRD